MDKCATPPLVNATQLLQWRPSAKDRWKARSPVWLTDARQICPVDFEGGCEGKVASWVERYYRGY